MVSVGDVKRSAAVLFGQGQYVPALRLYDAIVAAAPGSTARWAGTA
jgi:hypothetical protein